MNSSLPAQYESLFTSEKTLLYKKGEVIIRADDNPTGVFNLKNGYVKMNTFFDDGRELTLNIFKPGTYFPMIWAIGNVPNVYLFESLTDAQLYRIGRDKLTGFLKSQPEILYEFTRRVLVGMDAQMMNMKYLLNGVSSQRIIAALLILVKRFGVKSGGKTIINLPLTHQDIACLAGMTRETVSITLNKLRERGLISYSRHLIVIQQPEKLEKEVLIESDESQSLNLA
jgi:CRP/FNR family transcriptional regulator, cyclic AMP receptor protein